MAESQIRRISDDGDDGPLYRRVQKSLLAELSRGVWKPGDMLPTEGELARQMGVSAGTVRQAVLGLVRDGYIKRQSGRGTFVARMDNSKSFARFFRFREGDTGDRFVPQIKIASVEKLAKAPRQVTEKLGLHGNAAVLRVVRVISKNERPVCIYTSYLPYKLVSGLETCDLASERLYHIIEKHCGIHVWRAEEMLRATVADAKSAKLLDIDEGSPVVLIERLAFTHQDTVLEWRQTVGRSDDFIYKNRMP